jgi:hypothetical protein
MKSLMINFEHERVSHAVQRDYIIDSLVKENENLKRMLLIEHDAMGDVEQRIKDLESEEQAKAQLETKNREPEMPESV